MARASNPYGLSPALAQQVAAGESFLRDNMAAAPAPAPASPRAVVPAGTMYNAAGQRDGRAVGVPYGPGAYPVINTHNPTMVVLPPRLDLFSHMQNDYANFYRNMMPFITQMAQRAMQQGAKAARPVGRGNGSAAKPKTPPTPATMPKEPEFATYGQFPARWYPTEPMGPAFDDRDSFRLRQPGVRPQYQIGVKPTDRSWWPNPTMESPAPASTLTQPKPFVGGTMSYEGAYSPEPRYAYQDWKDTLKGIIDSPGSPIDAAINSFFQGVKKYFQ